MILSRGVPGRLQLHKWIVNASKYTNDKTAAESPRYSTILDKKYIRLIIMGMIFGKESVAEPSYKVLLQSLKTSTLPYEIRQYSDRYAVQTSYPIGTSTNIPFRKLAQYIGVFGTPNNIGQSTIDMTAPVSISTTTSSTSNADSTSKPVAIAMTAPVAIKTTTATTTQAQLDEDAAVHEKQHVMTFYLPSIYNEHPDTIPQPTDRDVTIQCIPGAIGAVHRFSGTMGDDPMMMARDKANQLRQQLCNDGITSFTSSSTTTGSNFEKDDDDNNNSFYEIWQYNPPFTIPAFRRNEIWVELTLEQFQELVNAQQQKLKQERQSTEMN